MTETCAWLATSAIVTRRRGPDVTMELHFRGVVRFYELTAAPRLPAALVHTDTRKHRIPVN
ncbi:hypothetical protein GCM10023334_046650 [Nonomuraea thailandensis]